MPPKSKQEFKRQVEGGVERYLEDHSEHEDQYPEDIDSDHGGHSITGTMGGLSIGGGLGGRGLGTGGLGGGGLGGGGLGGGGLGSGGLGGIGGSSLGGGGLGGGGLGSRGLGGGGLGSKGLGGGGLGGGGLGSGALGLNKGVGFGGMKGPGGGTGLGGHGTGRMNTGIGLGALGGVPHAGPGRPGGEGPPSHSSNVGGGLGLLGAMGGKGGLSGQGPKGAAAKGSAGTGKMLSAMGSTPPANDAYARALGDIVKDSSNTNREMIANIENMNRTNAAALGQVVTTIETLTDFTANTFNILAAKLRSADGVPASEDPLEALEAVLTNIDARIAATHGHVYVVVPGHSAGTVSADELARLVADKDISVYSGLTELANGVSTAIAEDAGEGEGTGEAGGMDTAD